MDRPAFTIRVGKERGIHVSRGLDAPVKFQETFASRYFRLTTGCKPISYLPLARRQNLRSDLPGAKLDMNPRPAAPFPRPHCVNRPATIATGAALTLALTGFGWAAPATDAQAETLSSDWTIDGLNDNTGVIFVAQNGANTSSLSLPLMLRFPRW